MLGELAPTVGAESNIIAVLTPDDDVYLEDFIGNKGDVAAARFASGRRVLPGGILRKRVYLFRTDVLGTLLDEALDQAE